MRRLREFFRPRNQDESVSTQSNDPQIKVYIWEKQLVDGAADIGHAGISVDGEYYSLWPSSGLFSPFGPLKFFPMPGALSRTLHEDELMQDKPPVNSEGVEDPTYKPVGRSADRVFVVDPSVQSDAIVAKIAQYQHMLSDGLLGYQFFDKYNFLEHLACDENLLEIRRDPFSGALIRESYTMFPPPKERVVTTGLNCTGFVISVLNEGLDESEQLPTNHFLPWRRSPDRLAVDLTEHNTRFSEVYETPEKSVSNQY